MAELDLHTGEAAVPAEPPPLRAKSSQLADLVAASVKRSLEIREMVEQQAAAIGIQDVDAFVAQTGNQRLILREAQACLQQGDYVGAEAKLRTQLADVPDHTEGLETLGLTLQAQQRIPEAEAAYQAAISAGLSNESIYANLGLMQFQQGKFDAAVGSFRRSIAISPNPIMLSNLGTVLERQGRLEEAIATLREALTLDPDLIQAAVNLAIMLFQCQQFEEAQRWLEHALARHAVSAHLYNLLGRVQMARNDVEAAIVSFRHALSLDAGCLPANEGLVLALKQLNRHDEARRVANQAFVLKQAGPAISSGQRSTWQRRSPKGN